MTTKIFSIGLIVAIFGCNTDQQIPEVRIEPPANVSTAASCGIESSSEDILSSADVSSGTIETDETGRTLSLYSHMADPDKLALQINSFPDLIILNIEFAFVSDATIEAILNCKQLRELYMGMPEKIGMDGKFSNSDLEAISNISSLRVLHIRSEKIDDQGAIHLSRLKNLQDLNLSGCNVTDEAIPVFEQLGSLEFVNLSHTGVTKSGIQRLSVARDDMSIQVEQGKNKNKCHCRE